MPSLQALFLNLNLTEQRVVDPISFLFASGLSIQDFRHQEDANEAVKRILDYIDRYSQKLNIDSTKMDSGTLNRRFYKETFEGLQNSVIRCPYGHESVTTTPFTDIMLEISSDIFQSFMRLFQAEEIDGYSCDECQKQGKATGAAAPGVSHKFMSFQNVGRVAALTLQRFAFDFNICDYVKNSGGERMPLALDFAILNGLGKQVFSPGSGKTPTLELVAQYWALRMLLQPWLFFEPSPDGSVQLKSAVAAENQVAQEEIIQAAQFILQIPEVQQHFLENYDGTYFHAFQRTSVPNHLQYCYTVPELKKPVKTLYILGAVICHIGQLNAGHYYTLFTSLNTNQSSKDCQNTEFQTKWKDNFENIALFEANDASVEKVQQPCTKFDQIQGGAVIESKYGQISDTGYMYFYQQSDVLIKLIESQREHNNDQIFNVQIPSEIIQHFEQQNQLIHKQNCQCSVHILSNYGKLNKIMELTNYPIHVTFNKSQPFKHLVDKYLKHVNEIFNQKASVDENQEIHIFQISYLDNTETMAFASADLSSCIETSCYKASDRSYFIIYIEFPCEHRRIPGILDFPFSKFDPLKDHLKTVTEAAERGIEVSTDKNAINLELRKFNKVQVLFVLEQHQEIAKIAKGCQQLDVNNFVQQRRNADEITEASVLELKVQLALQELQIDIQNDFIQLNVMQLKQVCDFVQNANLYYARRPSQYALCKLYSAEKGGISNITNTSMISDGYYNESDASIVDLAMCKAIFLEAKNQHEQEAQQQNQQHTQKQQLNYAQDESLVYSTTILLGYEKQRIALSLMMLTKYDNLYDILQHELDEIDQIQHKIGQIVNLGIDDENVNRPGKHKRTLPKLQTCVLQFGFSEDHVIMQLDSSIIVGKQFKAIIQQLNDKARYNNQASGQFIYVTIMSNQQWKVQQLVFQTLKYVNKIEMAEDQISIVSRPDKSLLHHYRTFLSTFWKRKTIQLQISKLDLSLIQMHQVGTNQQFFEVILQNNDQWVINTLKVLDLYSNGTNDQYYKKILAVESNFMLLTKLDIDELYADKRCLCYQIGNNQPNYVIVPYTTGGYTVIMEQLQKLILPQRLENGTLYIQTSQQQQIEPEMIDKLQPRQLIFWVCQ